MTRLAIVIVSFNARDDLERCLASIPDAASGVACDVVVVDNGSTDGSPEAVARRFPHVQVIATGTNLGFARATNRGIRATASELILLLNGDTILPRGALARLVDEIDARPEVAAIGPRLVDRAGRAELSFGSMLSPLAELRQKLLGTLYRRQFGPAKKYVERVTRREAYPDWVSGACLLVRRADAEAVGLLDERYFMYEEDVDFCAALRARGRRIFFTPRVEIVHLRGQSAATTPAATAAAYRRSHLAFYEKHHPAWVPLLRVYRRLTGSATDATDQTGGPRQSVL